MDVESGKDLGPNKEGEVWVRGPGLCSGYLNQPVRTRELIEEDRWLRTGIPFLHFLLRTSSLY